MSSEIMLLEDIGIAKITVNALNKNNIYTVNECAMYFPRKYLDYRKTLPITEAVGNDCAIAGYMECYEKKEGQGKTIIGADIIEENTGEKVHVRWYGQSWIFDDIKRFVHQELVICGKVSNHSVYGYQMLNPYSFHLKKNYRGTIIPIYKKMKRVSNDKLIETIRKCVDSIEEPLPEEVINKTKLLPYKEALRQLHQPQGNDDQTVEQIIEKPRQRIIFNEMLYFVLRLKIDVPMQSNNTMFRAEKMDAVKAFLEIFPYDLTKDQLNVFYDMKKKAATGNRINTLVQGDVGCGKTVIAFLAMILMADNGYQSVLMAPTVVLARQHYLELKQYADELGFNIVLLSNEMSQREKNKVLEDIKEGKTHFIIGTHSVFSKKAEYNNLGLIITDEEHKFGVRQRKAIEEKASAGVHVISMSATPIPRSIADVLYGENKELATIKTMPNGRKPVQTAVNRSEEKIFAFLAKQLNAGRQAYVVCPLIEADDRDGQMAIDSIEMTEQRYMQFFSPYGIKVATVTGKMAKEDVADVIRKFQNNEVQILISTILIEVGVNVPNATVMIINNAERFGLAQLHQLRGRVGRGIYQSYCILKSTDRYNARLLTMERTTDGFEIAQEDMKQRGMGDLLGTSQSGDNHYLDMIIKMPHLYNHVKKYADWMIIEEKGKNLLELYENEKEK